MRSLINRNAFSFLCRTYALPNQICYSLQRNTKIVRRWNSNDSNTNTGTLLRHLVQESKKRELTSPDMKQAFDAIFPDETRGDFVDEEIYNMLYLLVHYNHWRIPVASTRTHDFAISGDSKRESFLSVATDLDPQLHIHEMAKSIPLKQEMFARIQEIRGVQLFSHLLLRADKYDSIFFNDVGVPHRRILEKPIFPALHQLAFGVRLREHITEIQKANAGKTSKEVEEEITKMLKELKDEGAHATCYVAGIPVDNELKLLSSNGQLLAFTSLLRATELISNPTELLKQCRVQQISISDLLDASEKFDSTFWDAMYSDLLK